MESDNKKYWVSDPDHGFILGKLVDIGADSLTVEPFSTPGKTVTTSPDNVYPCEEYENKSVDDNCALMFLNEANLLNNIRIRYKKDEIYTYVANILIAINPYKDLHKLYSSDTVKAYHGRSLGTLPPHVFAIGDKSYRDMRSFKQSQSIIVSGESGAGKTESAKYLLRYLTESYGVKSGVIESRLNDSNPLLEAFGNAKTTRNNNSSRFGKFTELHFNEHYRVAGGFVSHYLLEKSRICVQSKEERNYHIFYRLCAGASDQLRKDLLLDTPDSFRYLNRGCTQYFCNSNKSKTNLHASRKSKDHSVKGPLQDPQLDDANDFLVCDKSMDQIGLSYEDKMNIYLTVAAVLHIGNIEFEEDPDSSKGGCRLQQGTKSTQSLAICAKMLGLDVDELEKALISRVMQAHRGGKLGTVIMVPLKVSEAQNARDALAKVIYIKLFDHIVACVNKAIPFGSSSSYFIGLLDIAGFEYFPVNSFEQFCINYCNEKLQQFFNERILKEEQFIYEKEGLGLSKISYSDNKDCIELIEAKNVGLFDMLDEESKLPTPSHTHFTAGVHAKYPRHFRLDVPRKSKLKSHREIRDDQGFLIRHFAGGVVYTTTQFIEKNNDSLHSSLAFLIQECKNKFIQNLFASESAAVKQNTGKLAFSSVGGKFRSQLTGLLDKLRSTGTNFIRCVKPNLKMVPAHFEGAQILSQLQCSGMTSVLTLMQQGYPSRTSFADLYEMYKTYLPPALARLDPRLFCKALFKALALKDADFKFGTTKVFFRPGKFSEFDQIMRSDPENLAKLVERVKKWLICSRWKKAQWCALSVIKLKNKIVYRRECLITLQKTLRAWSARRQFQPRIKGLRQIRTLQTQLDSMSLILKQLKSDKEQQKAQSSLASLQSKMNETCATIRQTNVPCSAQHIANMYNQLFSVCERDLAQVKGSLHAQKNKEEQERVRRIQEEMLREQESRVLEEKTKRTEEEARKQRTEIELRRKQEEEEFKKNNNTKSLAEQKETASREEEERQRAQQLADQEKRDHDLARRLAPEFNSEVDPIVKNSNSNSSSLASINRGSSSSSLMSSQSGNVASAVNGKHDLSKWKYAELRDAINTSCDLDLLEACREEFHRRLKVYHAWKSKNKKQAAATSTNGGTNRGGPGNGIPSSNTGAGALEETSERAPQSIIAQLNDVHISSSSQSTPKKTSPSSKNNPQQQSGTGSQMKEQRFFRIPFARPADQMRLLEGEGGETATTTADRKKGWWYSHFDGKWIARQMEIYDEKPSVLLLAGIDDMHMCELSLEETGLTMKQGAEVLESEFEEVWKRNGGNKYLSDHFGQISSKYVLQIMQRK